MKKLLVLLLTLCMICILPAAMAETADGSPLVLDGLTLNVAAGTVYELNERVDGEVYVTLYPYASSNDTASNINVIWNGEPLDISAEDLKTLQNSMEDEIAPQFEAAGLQLVSFTPGAITETTLDGIKCFYMDSEMVLSANGITIPIKQRQIYVGEKAFIFTITAMTDEARTAMTTMVNYILKWN